MSAKAGADVNITPRKVPERPFKKWVIKCFLDVVTPTVICGIKIRTTIFLHESKSYQWVLAAERFKEISHQWAVGSQAKNVTLVVSPSLALVSVWGDFLKLGCNRNRDLFISRKQTLYASGLSSPTFDSLAGGIFVPGRLILFTPQPCYIIPFIHLVGILEPWASDSQTEYGGPSDHADAATSEV